MVKLSEFHERKRHITMINFDYSKAEDFIKKQELDAEYISAKKAADDLQKGTGKGSDFIGWRDLPINYDKKEVERIKKEAKNIREKSQVLVVVGIGGSYLGTRMVIEALSGYFCKKELEVIYAGNSLSSDYLNDLLDYLKGKEFSVNIISKSGTTTEPAIAFRLIKKLMEEKYGKDEASKRIYVTTDKNKGALRELAIENGYETFVVPDDVGGRYSVLTAVGLFPIACAGFDIEKLMSGAAFARKNYDEAVLNYAAVRNVLYKKGNVIELFVNYEPKLSMLLEWLKQLFGESEGKEGKGIFPVGLTYTTDLHSMGQYVQEGRRMFFETGISIENSNRKLEIPKQKDDSDGLDYLEGRDLHEINKIAAKATAIAHIEGMVPNLEIQIDRLDEENLGELIYFFEKTCAVSGYINDINPFNQPGVESYKRNMFELLGKPGFEKEGN